MYHHQFVNQSLEVLVGRSSRVRVWTVVHGQLISCSSSTVADSVLIQPSRQGSAEPEDPAPETPEEEGRADSPAGVGSSSRLYRPSPEPSLATGTHPSALSFNVTLNTVNTSSRIYTKRSVSESNLGAGAGAGGRFNRRAGNRQSMPQGYTNYGLTLESEEEGSQLEI